MSKSIMAAAALSVVAGLGVAALPLSSYAAELNDPKLSSASEEIDVIVHIDDTISMTVDNSTVEMNLIPDGAVVTESIKASVTTSGAKGYTLYISDSNDDTALVSEAGDRIEAAVEDATAKKIVLGTGESAWAYQGGDETDWTAITVNNVAIKTVTYSETDPKPTEFVLDEAADTVITFGSWAKGGQAQGTYKGGVILTAVAATPEAPAAP